MGLASGMSDRVAGVEVPSLVGLEWSRKILHVDLDAFYPSVEVLDDPSLAGRAVIVGGLGQRGVVASASYEAREKGVHSAMPMARARRLCPDAVYLRPRFDRYRELSGRVRQVFGAWTERVEPLSLDEAYLDVSHHVSSPVDIARAIRAQIRRDTGLTASAGVATNKFLAKLASDMDKPDGLTVIRPEEAAARLRPLPVRKLWGVGPATAEMLEEAGLATIGDVADVHEERVVELLGSAGTRIWAFAHGRDDRRVEPPGRPKTISSETTYERDRRSWKEAWPDVSAFAEELAGRLDDWELAARTVTLKVRFQDFRTITRSLTPGRAVHDVEGLRATARALVERVELGRRQIRLVGLGASNLVDRDAPVSTDPQMTLWELDDAAAPRPGGPRGAPGIPTPGPEDAS